MGSIPLPALDIKTPQQPDLLEKYGQLQQLKASQQQQQIRAQQAPLQQQALEQNVQQGQLGLQQQQQALKDQQAATTAMQQWDGKDIDQLYPLVLKNGGSATAVMSLKEKVLKQKQDAATAFKNTADGGKAIVETNKAKGDLIGGALSDLADPSKVPDAALPQELQTRVQGLLANGTLDQQHAQAAMQLLQQSGGDPNKIRQGVGQFIKTNMALSQVLEDAHKEALTAQAVGATANKPLEDAETKRYHDAEIAARNKGLSIEGARLAFDKQRQGTQDQASIDAQAQQIATGDLKLPPQGRNNPLSAAIRARAFEINPNLSDELYSTKQDFLSSKGKANAQVQSLNKLSAHLGELQAASEKAGFSPVGFTAAGKDLRLAEQLFSKEDVKFLSGSGVGTEGELNGLIEKTHSPVQSVRDSAINTLSRFTADAARQLGDQYERGTKQKFDPNQHFTPTTVQMMQKSGGTSARESSGGLSVTAPNGKVYTFKDQASADSFKQKAGIQ